VPRIHYEGTSPINSTNTGTHPTVKKTDTYKGKKSADR
jgi:hypothetical protein